MNECEQAFAKGLLRNPLDASKPAGSHRPKVGGKSEGHAQFTNMHVREPRDEGKRTEQQDLYLYECAGQTVRMGIVR